MSRHYKPITYGGKEADLWLKDHLGCAHDGKPSRRSLPTHLNCQSSCPANHLDPRSNFEDAHYTYLGYRSNSSHFQLICQSFSPCGQLEPTSRMRTFKLSRHELMKHHDTQKR